MTADESPALRAPTWHWLDGTPPWVPGVPAATRVIADNDFAGDPDDLAHLAHHLLSPGVEVRAVVSSHLRPGDPFHPEPGSAAAGARRVRELAATMRLDLGDALVTGSEDGLVDEVTPQDSPAARRIVAEAMADDPRPLFVACGGGLTDLASALLLEPAIADRLTAVWIGGPEDPSLAAPAPGNPTPEYNLGIDVVAARVVLASRVRFWQVPRNAYRSCLVSEAELRRRIGTAGPLGALLEREIGGIVELVRTYTGTAHATYVLGDQPLVLLTALRTVFEPDTASSDHVVRPAPRLGPNGEFVDDPEGRPIRVYTRLDNRLMFEDLYLRLADHAEWVAGRG